MDSRKLIAIVEDEAAIRENYAAALRHNGYRVKGYSNRREALDSFGQRLPDLVIIDINLGDEVEGGFELCRELRARASQLPIIFLTARESELDEVSGLRLGADDYLTKRISLDHMLVRVTALLRRVEALTQMPDEPKLLKKGQLVIDLERMSVSWKGIPISLTLTELWVLHALARRPGHLKTRQQLMDAAEVVVDENTVTSWIKRIRDKFKAGDPETDWKNGVLVGEHGSGYRWYQEKID